MKKGVIGTVLLVLVLLTLLPLTGGCGTAKAPAEAEIRIGIMGGLTGPAPAAVAGQLEEMENMFGYINEVEGGIEGAKLNWRIVDNKGTPDGAIIAYKELRDTFDPLLYVAVEDYILVGIKDMIAEDEAVILTLSAIYNQNFVPPGRFFSMAIPNADGFAGYINWVLEDWQGPGQPKVGVLHWDMPSGLQWRLAEGWVRKQGVELVPVQYAITALDLKPQFMNLRDAGVDYIWMHNITPNAAVAVRDFRGLGLVDKIPLTFCEFTEAHVLLSIVGTGATGFYEYHTEGPYSDGSEAAKLYSEISKWATGEDKWSDNRIFITLKAVLSAAIEQAVADVGWDNLDSQAIYNALNKLTTIDTWGNMKDFGFGPDKRIGVSTMKMKQYTETGTVAVSDWIELPRIFEGVEQ